MKNFEGYLKRKFGDSYVLLAGGGEKLLSSFAFRNTWNDFIHNTNEFTFASPLYSGEIFLNYRTASGSADGAITQYLFGDGAGSYADVVAKGFKVNGADNTSVILAGGSTKALNDFSMSGHGHNYAGSPSNGGPADKLNSTDKRDQYPATIIPNYSEAAMTFMLMSTLGINNHGYYADVLSMSSYGDSSGGNENAIIFAKNDYSVWHTQFGVKSTNSWGTPYLFADSANSSVSGGGSSLGSSITVKICETEKTLTIPSSIAWSLLTGIPSSFTPASHNHSYLVGTYNDVTGLPGEAYIYYTYHVNDNTAGTPSTVNNANGILSINRHGGNYWCQIGFGADSRIKYRSFENTPINTTATWNVLAYKSEIPTSMSWSSVTSKPATATRWPTWDEVTGKPSTFPPSDHDHQRILPTRHDSDAPNPSTKGTSLTFQFSYFDDDWWNVLNMRSYGDYQYMSAQLLTPAGNPGSDTGYGDMYWRQGRNTTWMAKRKILDSSNYTSYTYSISLSDARFVRSFHNASTNPSINTFTDTAYFLTLADSGSWAGGTQPSGSHNGLGIINMHTHTGNYYTLLALDTNLNRLWIRSANDSSSWSGWKALAYTSEIPTNTWRPITNTYTGSDQSTSVSQYGTNALYNALVNGYANEAGSATRCRYVTCPDTRDTMPAPGDYTASTTGVSFDFKYNGVSGLTGAYYAGIMTVRPYASGQDWSGGPAHQLAFNGDGRLLHRTGTSSWGSWVVVPQCDTSGNLTCTGFIKSGYNDNYLIAAGGGYAHRNNLGLSTTATALNALDVTYSLISVTIGAAGPFNLGISAAMSAGLCLTAIVYNSTGSTVQINVPQSFPSSTEVVSLDGSLLNCPAYKYLEISILCHLANKYVVSSKGQ